MTKKGRDGREDSRALPRSDPGGGIWAGRQVARAHVSPDGLTVLVGLSAADNDLLTFKLASPHDFWLHRSGGSGAHVVVLNPDRLDRLPRDTESFAANLAVTHSPSGAGGRFKVHILPCRDVRKPRGAPRGTVQVKKGRTVWGRASEK